MPDATAIKGSKSAVSGADLINYGKQFLGKPYAWGAEGPNSFDCSGLVQTVFRHFGIVLPRTTWDQVKAPASFPISRGQEKPGDLIFSSWDGKPNSHVGIYAGNGKILHAGKPVKIQTLDTNYWNHVTALRRVPGVDGAAAPTGSTASGVAGGPATDPGLLGALNNIGTGVQGIATGVATMGRVADALLSLALPSNLVRAVSGAFGVGFLAVGLLFLMREVRNA